MAIYLTRKGFESLHAELRELIEVRRPQVMADLAQAREYGDIRENAEYETAKRDQGLNEGRIHELEEMLSSVEIAECPANPTEVMMGACVTIENLDSGSKRTCTLVSEQETHVDECYLSMTSPLGKSLIGAKKGDVVIFDAPAGVRKFKILDLHGANGHK